MYNPFPEIHREILVDLNEDNEISRYFLNKLADYLKLDQALTLDNILFINGADAALCTLTSALYSGKKVGYFDLNYKYASHQIRSRAKECEEIKTLWDTQKGERSLRKNMPSGLDFIHVTNPDNRLGLCIKTSDILALQEHTPCVIVDEAYVDFEPMYSAMQETISDNNNFLVIRTFSKFFTIESCRIGYVVSNKRNIMHLRQFVAQYPIATSSIIEAIKSLSVDPKSLFDKREEIRKLKESVYSQCEVQKVDYSCSQTNFVTIFNVDPRIFLQSIEPFKVKEFFLDDKISYRVVL